MPSGARQTMFGPTHPSFLGLNHCRYVGEKPLGVIHDSVLDGVADAADTLEFLGLFLALEG